jgi:hypothetical protein
MDQRTASDLDQRPAPAKLYRDQSLEPVAVFPKASTVFPGEAKAKIVSALDSIRDD